MPLHVEMAQKASDAQPQSPLASAAIGDARALDKTTDNSVDAVLLFGPLYHLTEREERLQSLREAHRVLKPGGMLLAVVVSRFASTVDGLRQGLLKDAECARIVKQDLADGQHRNPTRHPEYFTDTFFHHPTELRREVAESGFSIQGLYGVEVPSWLPLDFDSWWVSPEIQERLLEIARKLETEGTFVGVSSHIMVRPKSRTPTLHYKIAVCPLDRRFHAFQIRVYSGHGSLLSRHPFCRDFPAPSIRYSAAAQPRLGLYHRKGQRRICTWRDSQCIRSWRVPLRSRWRRTLIREFF
jgi:hypothetical protein